jgi:hypothetical protein
MHPAIAAIIDQDQGVCPEGHDCHISQSVEGNVARSCDDADNAYMGYPVIADGVTQAQVEAARLIDPKLAEWAESSIADREGIA